MDAPLQGDTGGHTGTAPTNLHHIFPRNPTQTKEPFAHNPPKRNQPPTRNPQNGINRPCAIYPNKTVGAVPACPPKRPRSGVSIPKIHASCARINDGCAPAGRHGRAHRHRPYPSPSYFSTQSYTNKRTIYMQSAQTKPTVHTQSTQTTSTVPRAIYPNENVGAVPVCPPERPHGGVSIPKIYVLCAGDERQMRPCGAARAGTQQRFHT